MADQNQNQTVEGKESLPDQKQTRKAKAKKADTKVESTDTKAEITLPQESSPPPSDSNDDEIKEILIKAVFENSRSTCKLVLVVGDNEPLFTSVASIVCSTKSKNSSSGSFTAFWTESIETDEQAIDKEGNKKFKKDGSPQMKRQTTTHKENWVVGKAASRIDGHIKMVDLPDGKVKYFPQLFMGALASLSDVELKKISTPGDKAGKTRKLNIEIITQSISSGEELRKSLLQYKAIEFKGTKFKFKFAKGGESHPENFGIALHGFEEQSNLPKEKKPDVIGTVDCGEGTLMVIPYSINGSIPSDNDAFLHGGGGMAALKYQFLKTAGQKDTSSETDIDFLENVLFAAKWENNDIVLLGDSYADLKDPLKIAIQQWLKGTQAQVAIRNAVKIALRYPIYLCGGGFACEPVFEMFKAELLKNGVSEDNINQAPEPQFTGVKHTGRYYASKQQA